MLKKVEWVDQVQKLELNLNTLKESGLKCNTGNYFFGQTKMEYLGFWVTRYGIKPINKKKAIKNTAPPTSWKGIHKFKGLVSYYHNI